MRVREKVCHMKHYLFYTCTTYVLVCHHFLSAQTKEKQYFTHQLDTLTKFFLWSTFSFQISYFLNLLSRKPLFELHPHLLIGVRVMQKVFSLADCKWRFIFTSSPNNLFTGSSSETKIKLSEIRSWVACWYKRALLLITGVILEYPNYDW